MEPEAFLLEMSESKKCKEIIYKRIAIRMYIGIYFAMKPDRGCIDNFMIPFRDFIKEQFKD